MFTRAHMLWVPVSEPAKSLMTQTSGHLSLSRLSHCATTTKSSFQVSKSGEGKGFRRTNLGQTKNPSVGEPRSQDWSSNRPALLLGATCPVPVPCETRRGLPVPCTVPAIRETTFVQRAPALPCPSLLLWPCSTWTNLLKGEEMLPPPPPKKVGAAILTKQTGTVRLFPPTTQPHPVATVLALFHRGSTESTKTSRSGHRSEPRWQNWRACCRTQVLQDINLERSPPLFILECPPEPALPPNSSP